MNAPTRPTNVSTPCVRLCALDAATGLCAGCGRTLAEIGGWLGLGEDERRAIMAALPERRAAARAGPPPR